MVNVSDCSNIQVLFVALVNGLGARSSIKTQSMKTEAVSTSQWRSWKQEEISEVFQKELKETYFLK